MNLYAAMSMLSLALLALGGCSVFETETAPPTRPVGPDWVIHNGQTGIIVGWDQLSAQALAADIILMGEQHNDAIGHQLQLKLAQALLAKQPDAAIAMEMFERNEQSFVDLYLDGDIQAETLIEITHSADWAGKGTWANFYQPIVDAAKAHREQGAAVIAANAPREYARLARLENYRALDLAAASHDPTPAKLPDETVDDQAYRDRFIGMMIGHSHGENAPQIDAEAYLRAQRVWDATMADSVLAAREAHAKVLLLIGDFHVANQGGTLQRIRHEAPEMRIVTISMIAKEDINQWNPDDAGRADFVIYTQKPNPEK